MIEIVLHLRLFHQIWNKSIVQNNCKIKGNSILKLSLTNGWKSFPATGFIVMGNGNRVCKGKLRTFSPNRDIERGLIVAETGWEKHFDDVTDTLKHHYEQYIR